MRHILRTIAVVALLAAQRTSAAADRKGVLLLNGFEPDVLTEWVAQHPAKRGGYEGSVYVDAEGRFCGGGIGSPCVEGDATEGKFALVRQIPGKGKWTLGFLTNEKTRESIRRMQGKLLCHCGAFRRYYPKDWSGYARFRADVKCQGSPLRLRVILEDSISISRYCLKRVYEIPRDKWVTVEVDLSEAARLRKSAPPGGEAGGPGVGKTQGRLLNLEEMANIWIAIELVGGKCEVKLDNLRLVAAEAAKGGTKLTVLTDDRPFVLPRALPPSRPRPREPVKGKLNTAPIQWAEPAEIPNIGSVFDVAAVDNDRLLLAVNSAKALRTLDGGKTWTGLDGKANVPTKVIDHDTNAPGRWAAALGPDVMVLGVAKCSGGGIPVDSYSVLTRFDGSDWKVQPRGLVDVDVRHCPEWKVRLVRLPSGRIWACWLHRPRLGPFHIAARFSDDEGRTWRDPAANGVLDITSRGKANPYCMTWWQTEPAMPYWAQQHALGRVAPMHPHSLPAIAAWGEHVMVAFGQKGEICCAFFDGLRWSEAVRTGIKGDAASLVGFEGETVYMASTDGKVYRLVGHKWVKDSPPGGIGKGRLPYPGCPKARLSVAGKVLVASWADGRKLFVSSKPKGGAWSKPREVFTEEAAVLWIAAPTRSVDNFVPLAWTTQRKEGGGRFVRIPVTQPPR